MPTGINRHEKRQAFICVKTDCNISKLFQQAFICNMFNPSTALHIVIFIFLSQSPDLLVNIKQYLFRFIQT
ncbi:hypothetical protein L1887_23836 [Cichorium endivia]|nr:hypothetical protein L1887_23836 [Cichorium endivia]